MPAVLLDSVKLRLTVDSKLCSLEERMEWIGLSLVRGRSSGSLLVCVVFFYKLIGEYISSFGPLS